MRKILFRGKRVDNNEWVYGYYARCEDDYYIYAPENICLDKETNHYENVLTRYEIHPENVGQFTEHKDDNKKEIYEGDRVKVIWWANYSGDEIFGTVKMVDGCWDVILDTPQYDTSAQSWKKRRYLKCFTVNRAIEIIKEK